MYLNKDSVDSWLLRWASNVSCVFSVEDSVSATGDVVDSKVVEADGVEDWALVVVVEGTVDPVDVLTVVDAVDVSAAIDAVDVSAAIDAVDVLTVEDAVDVSAAIDSVDVFTVVDAAGVFTAVEAIVDAFVVCVVVVLVDTADFFLGDVEAVTIVVLLGKAEVGFCAVIVEVVALVGKGDLGVVIVVVFGTAEVDVVVIPAVVAAAVDFGTDDVAFAPESDTTYLYRDFVVGDSVDVM